MSVLHTIQEWLLNRIFIYARAHHYDVTGIYKEQFIIHDITERTQIERKISESHDFYLTLFNQFPVLIWRSRLDTQCDFFNSSWLQFTGRTLEQESGIGWAEGVHPEDYQRCLDIYLNAFQQREPYDIEYRLRRYDGEYRWILGNGRPYHNLDGKFAGYIGSCYDITERKLAEEIVKESEERYRRIVETANEGVWVINAQNETTFVNGKMAHMLGYTVEEMIGKTLYSFMDETGLPAATNQVERRHQVISEQHDFKFKRKDGSDLWAIFTTTTILDAAGRYAGALGMVSDITRRKNAEAQLVRAKEIAETANQFKSEFLANMSHEIRTPMNGVIGMSELLLGTELTPEQHDYLTIIKDSADSLLNIINDVLDFSKIEAGKLELNKVAFNPRKLVEKINDTFALLALSKGIELLCRVDPELPSSLYGDPDRLRQILVNLIGNAIKFTEKGEILITVENASEDQIISLDKCLIQFSVKDTGMGIPQDKMHMLFQNFSQLDASSTRKSSGSGLGLAISKKLVELMDGSIKVVSKVHEGSIFSFQIPMLINNPDSLSQLEKNNIQGLRAMIIDDNLTSCTIIAEILKSQQIIVDYALSGKDGIGKLQKANAIKEPFQIVLIDSDMPKMDGFTVAEQIKNISLFKNEIIMMVTSDNIQKNLARCRELSVTCLIKPLKQKVLLEMIADSLKINLLTTAQVKSFSGRESIQRADEINNLRILMAEDNVVNQKVAVTLLQKKGWQVTTVANGKEAVDIFNSKDFDLILMDVQMPKMDGFDATKAIRAKEGLDFHIPIIAMTAFARAEDRELCLSAGMDDYIAKPLSSADLYEVIECWMSYAEGLNQLKAVPIKN
jgi:PAS domain S-box-containing protein